MEVKIYFAERLTELRKKNRLTQKEVGDVIGLTAKSDSTMESGLRQTTFEKLALLAKFFNVSTDYLLGLKDEP